MKNLFSAEHPPEQAVLCIVGGEGDRWRNWLDRGEDPHLYVEVVAPTP